MSTCPALERVAQKDTWPKISPPNRGKVMQMATWLLRSPPIPPCESMSVRSSIFVLFHVLALNYEQLTLSAISDPPHTIFPLLSSGLSMGLAGPHKAPAMQPLNFCVLACEPLFLMTAR